MTSASYTNITIQDNFDGITGTLSTPLGTENILPVPPVFPAPVNASTQPGVNTVISQVVGNQQTEKIVPARVYFSATSAAVMSVVYCFKHFA